VTAFQGDQIGRIFDHWAAVYFGQFFYCSSSPNFWSTSFHCKSDTYILTINGLAYTLGDFFFTNSSGHPAVPFQTSDTPINDLSSAQFLKRAVD
jgi:hypothetical protein